jgi:hypothetical protein
MVSRKKDYGGYSPSAVCLFWQDYLLRRNAETNKPKNIVAAREELWLIGWEVNATINCMQKKLTYIFKYIFIF